MNTTNLKLLALILMLFDHVAEFIPGMPIWFHWIGRISAPIFFFCTVWGLYYTHDRKKYLGRLYVSGAAMGIIVYIFNNCCPNPQRYITNNIFVTLFLIGCISTMIEKWKEDRKKGWKLFLIFFLQQAVSTALCIASGLLLYGYGGYALTGALTGNLLFTEGSFLFVFLGVLMYFTKEKCGQLIAVYTAFSVFMAFPSLADGGNPQNLLYGNYQWMMIAALPFMLLYNGEKGRGFKYLFYVFYPAHILILFLIGNYAI